MARQQMKTAFFKTENGYIKFDSVGQRDKYKACERKFCYTNLVANIAIKNVYKKEGLLLSTYACPYCKMWHLTHKKQK
jgi:hypothetical protein